MAGLMVVTVLVGLFCKRQSKKYFRRVAEYGQEFNRPAIRWDFGYMSCCFAVWGEVLLMFVVSIWCGISKML